MALSMASRLAIVAVVSLGLKTLRPEFLIRGSQTATTLSLFSLLILWHIIYNVSLYPRYFTPFKSIPQMNLIGRFMNRRDIEAAFMQFTASEQNHNGLLRCYMPHAREMLLVLGAEGLADVLVRKPYHFEKPKHIKFDLNYLFANGLFTAEGLQHKALRKSMAPAFAFRQIKSLYPVFWHKSVEMVGAINKQFQQQQGPDHDTVVQIHDWTTRATLDIIGLAGMGFDFGSLRDPDSRIHLEYKRLTSCSRKPHILLALVRAFGFETIFRIGLAMPSEEKRRRGAALEVVRGVAGRMVQSEKAKLEKGIESHNIVSVAVESGNFADADLVDEAMTFIGAGHESTSAAMLWGVYCLCRHPDVQERARNEVLECLGKNRGISGDGEAGDDAGLTGPSMADKIHHLPYFNAFVNEVLRFWPSVPVTLRRAVCDTTIADVFVPKDTALGIPIRAINRDKRLWGPTADVFDPQRWLEPGMANSGGAAVNYANMTFLHGPRSCIGRDFARSELLFLLAALVAGFGLEMEDPERELECELQITILPVDGLRVRLTPLSPV